MLHNNIGRLPVVDRQNPDQLVGYLGRAAIMDARRRRLHEEHVREPGWLKRATLPIPFARPRKAGALDEGGEAAAVESIEDQQKEL